MILSSTVCRTLFLAFWFLFAIFLRRTVMWIGHSLIRSCHLHDAIQWKTMQMKEFFDDLRNRRYWKLKEHEHEEEINFLFQQQAACFLLLLHSVVRFVRYYCDIETHFDSRFFSPWKYYNMTAASETLWLFGRTFYILPLSSSTIILKLF